MKRSLIFFSIKHPTHIRLGNPTTSQMRHSLLIKKRSVCHFVKRDNKITIVAQRQAKGKCAESAEGNVGRRFLGGGVDGLGSWFVGRGRCQIKFIDFHCHAG